MASVSSARKVLPSCLLGRRATARALPSLVSRLGLGGVGLGEVYGAVSEADAVACVARAVELGVTLIDTSPNYGGGRSEERIGLALNELGRSGSGSAGLAGGVTLVTKCGDPGPQNGGHSPFSREGVHHSLRESLRLLRPPRGRLDFLLLHDPSQEDLDEFFADGVGGFEAFRELLADGTVVGTGVGVREHDVLLRFIEHPSDLADVVLTVNDWNLLRRYAEPELFAAAEGRGASVLNGGPLYLGLLSGMDPALSFSQGGVKSGLKCPELIDLATRVRSWCHREGLDLRALALHLAAGPGAPDPPIASALVGARFASEIEELVDSMLLGCVTEVERYATALTAFESVFGAEVRAFDTLNHVYYNKNEMEL